MLEKLTRVIEDTVDDLGYIAKRSATFVVGKGTGQVAGLLAGIAIGSLAGGGETIGKVLGVGAVAGVSGGMTQMDFKHSREQLLERYRDEVASMLGKAPDQVQEADLELVARGDFKSGVPANPTIRKELKNTWLQRNVNFVLASVVSAVTYVAVHAVDRAYGGDGGIYNGITSIIGQEGNLAAFIMDAARAANFSVLGDVALALGKNGLIGLVAYHGIKTPAHWAASEVLGIDEYTVNDRVTSIKRTLGHGHEIQPEQVLGVFIHAHHDIEEQIKAEYGKEFDHMSRDEKQTMLAVVEKYMDVSRVTEDINKGRMRPEELAFAAHGQSSGIGIGEEGSYVHHGNVLDGMWKGLKAVTEGWTKTAASGEQVTHVTNDLSHDLPGKTTVTVNTPDNHHASMHLENEHEQPGRKQSFVARVARSMEPSADGLSHVERYQQSSSGQAVITPS